MAYELPPQWEHGDYPTAALINKYKTGLDDIESRVGEVKINPYVTFRMSGIQSFFIVHHHRWLLYRGTGWIEDPLHAEENVTLTGSGSDWFSYDLVSVEWLREGKLYQIQNVDACFEDRTPF